MNPDNETENLKNVVVVPEVVVLEVVVLEVVVLEVVVLEVVVLVIFFKYMHKPET